ncbi:hypothetical protein [Pelagicoccus mobilis]|uniref:Sulfotransferase domain-containing protein n=1 Tax=Pelagicoccus mobilis TaxID=415221 RepID=A0A934S5U6_9BACT|nr:hypothetical protein [Pelagicoccus mobilis]MBK1879498.1 hypothetical protein [Pelagicoccus mobilis]
MNIFVLGMHRSGTSVLGRLLSRMGFYLGPEDQIMPPKDDNPSGFWERRDIRDVNDKILGQFDSTWDCPPQITLPSKNLSPDIAQDLNTIRVRMESNYPFYIKDPRLSITLPYWLDNKEPALAIIALRNPVEVAKSLSSRNGIPMNLGLALWESYTIDAIKNTKKLKRHFYNYNNLLEDPKGEIENLLKFIKKYNRQKVDSNYSELKDLIRIDLRHNKAKEETAELKRYTDLFRALTKSEVDLESIELSSESKKVLDIHRSLYNPRSIRTLSQELVKAKDGYNQIVRQVDRFEDESKQSKRELESTRSAQKSAETELASLQSELKKSNSEISKLLAIKESEKDLKQQLQESLKQREKLEQDLLTSKLRFDSSEERLDRANSEVEALRDLGNTLQNERAQKLQFRIQLEGLERQLKEQQIALEQKSKELREYDKTKFELTNCLQELSRKTLEVENLEERCAELERRLTLKDKQLAESHSRVELLSKRVDELVIDSSLSKFESKLSRVRVTEISPSRDERVGSLLDSIRSEILHLEQDVKSNPTAGFKTATALGAALAECLSIAQSLRGDLESVQESETNCLTRIRSLERQSNTRSETIKRLITKLRIADEQAISIRNKYEKSITTKSELETTNKSLSGKLEKTRIDLNQLGMSYERLRNKFYNRVWIHLYYFFRNIFGAEK